MVLYEFRKLSYSNIKQLYQVAKWSGFRRVTTIAKVVEEPNGSKETTRPDKESILEARDTTVPSNYRFIFPEFLPDPNPDWRNSVREKLERYDMLDRRQNISIPEFYVGSILAVTVSDRHAPTKDNRFVGLCIQRTGCGLRSSFVLRNVIDHQGIENKYYLYSPVIREIQILRLEKRLDKELFFLRDAPQEYSTFPFDMEPEFHAEGATVPINTMVIKLSPRPWQQKWHLKELKGVDFSDLKEKFKIKAEKNKKPWEKYDIMMQYRATIPDEEQREIFSEIYSELQDLESKQRKFRKKKVFLKPSKPNIL